MTDQTKVPLTADQLKARAEALANANKPATPLVPASPIMPATMLTAPAKPTDTARPVTGDKPVEPVKPTSDLLKAATAALSNGTPVEADKAVAALATAANKPVEPVKVATPGTVPVTKPQGGKPTTANPHTHPVPNGKQGGLVTKPATKPANVSAVPKAKPKGKTETAMSNPDYVLGYNMAAWPKGEGQPVAPSKADIMASYATGLNKPGTKNALALAYYLSRDAAKHNVYDVAVALQNVCGGNPDHKMNVINQRLVPAGLGTVIKGAVTGRNGGRALVTYAAKLTPKGLKLVEKAFADANPPRQVPQYLMPATAGKGTVQPAKPATATL